MTGAQNIKSVMQIWPFVVAKFKEAGKWEDLIHGGRHIQRVKEEAEIMVASNKLDGSVALCLEIAAEIHDIGHILPGDHAENSAEIFNQMPLDLGIYAKEAIGQAVRDHSVGLVGKGITRAKSLYEKVLGLLVVCDHCGDAACPEGVARAALALKDKPILSKKFSAEKLDFYLGSESEFVLIYPIPIEEMNEYKSDSLLAHLVYDYQATWPIIDVVKHLLSGEYLNNHLLPRQEMFGIILKTFIKLQRMTV